MRCKETMNKNKTFQNEIKSYIVRSGLTMTETLHRLSERCGWSPNLSNFSVRLKNGTLRYSEMMELAEVLGYEIVWRKKFSEEHRD